MANPPVSVRVNLGDTAHALAKSKDDAQVRRVMNALAPQDAARLVQHAPGVEGKSRLLWAMERKNRAEALDHMPPALFALLVQNLEARNKHLLGALSMPMFQDLLRVCSPQMRLYWLGLANSVHDDAASLLTFASSPRDLAEALMTSPDFRKQLIRLANQGPHQAEGTPLGLDEVSPLKDPTIRRILETLVDFFPELYRDVLQAALDLSDYQVNHSMERDWMTEQPMVRQGSLDAWSPDEQDTVPEPPAIEAELSESRAAMDAESVLPVLLPSRDDALLPTAETWTEESRLQLARLFQSEVELQGGSFARPDLERAAGRVATMIHLGRLAISQGLDTLESGEEPSPERLAQAGNEWLDVRLQRAARLLAFREGSWLGADQLRLLESVIHPQVGIYGRPDQYMLFLKAGARGATATVPLNRLDRELGIIWGWLALARSVLKESGKTAVTWPAGAAGVLTSLVVSQALYRRWSPHTVDLEDVKQFQEEYWDRGARVLLPEVRLSIADAVAAWADEHRMTGNSVAWARTGLEDAADRMESILREHKGLTPKLVRRHFAIPPG